MSDLADDQCRLNARAFWVDQGLPKRTAHALADNGVYDLASLSAMSRQELARVINMGKVGLKAIETFLGCESALARQADQLTPGQQSLRDKWAASVGENRLCDLVELCNEVLGEDLERNRMATASALIGLVRMRRLKDRPLPDGALSIVVGGEKPGVKLRKPNGAP